ncbi:MAG: hypothetical protein ACI89X_003674 [Planctomycetota bacterium]|jgi:hypothetical protein
MSLNEPPDLPDMTPPAVKPTWTWALVIAGVYGLFHFAQQDASHSTAHNQGAAVGAAIVPLFAAWLATLFTKKPHTPTVITGAIVALMLIGGNATQTTIARVEREYSAELEERLTAWTKHGAAWQGSGGCDPSVIKEENQLRNNLQLAVVMKKATAELLGELQSGDDYRNKLAEAGVEHQGIAVAWSNLQTEADYDVMVEMMQATDALMESITLYLGELKHRFGEWHVDADGVIEFDADVEDSFIKRVNQFVDDMQVSSQKLEEQAERQGK